MMHLLEYSLPQQYITAHHFVGTLFNPSNRLSGTSPNAEFAPRETRTPVQPYLMLHQLSPFDSTESPEL